MTLFPTVQRPETTGTAGLPLYREVKWDFERNIPVFQDGNPVMLEGKEAVLVWAWKALHTPRFRHEIYSWSYGSELEGLVGQPYTGDLKRAEAVRYIKETLEINPYISGVHGVSASFDGDRLCVACTLETVYGMQEVGAVV